MSTTVEALAALIAGEARGDLERTIDAANSIDKAGPRDVTFVADEKNLRKLKSCAAGAVIVARRLAAALPVAEPAAALILVDEPFGAFVRVLEHFRPRRPRPAIGVSHAAFVSPSARIGANTNVYPGAYVGDDAVIGERCDIHPGVSVGAGCRIGNDVTLHPRVVLYSDVTLGDRVAIHAGAVIGADGFGYRLLDGRREKIPHFGTVRIESDVEIGACTTVDRAMIGETVLGEGTKLDNLVMIGHNCEVGRHNAFVAQVGLAGSVTTGDYVVLAGHVGVADHVRLGEGCTVGSKAGVHKDVPPGETYIGLPAEPVAEAMKVVMAQKKLPEMRRTVRRLETKVAELTAKLDALLDARPESSNSAA